MDLSSSLVDAPPPTKDNDVDEGEKGIDKPKSNEKKSGKNDKKNKSKIKNDEKSKKSKKKKDIESEDNSEPEEKEKDKKSSEEGSSDEEREKKQKSKKKSKSKIIKKIDKEEEDSEPSSDKDTKKKNTSKIKKKGKKEEKEDSDEPLEKSKKKNISSKRKNKYAEEEEEEKEDSDASSHKNTKKKAISQRKKKPMEEEKTKKNKTVSKRKKKETEEEDDEEKEDSEESEKNTKKKAISKKKKEDEEKIKKEKAKNEAIKKEKEAKKKEQEAKPKQKKIIQQKLKSDYITNIHVIKPVIKSKNENGKFLKDNIDTSKKNETDEFILYSEQNITNDIDILEENKKKLKKSEKFFNDIGYVLTDKSCERMAMLIHYILSGIPVLLEGPTGTSKTRTTLIACEYITKILNKDSDDDDSLLRFNLSAETKIDDLLVKFTGDNNSASGLKVEEGQFFKAYTKGHKILLDQINLAPREVLECIQQALDSKILSVECSGKILKKYNMHPNFGIIATQNPNKGAFANKRQELGVGFLSRFQKINFPNFTKEELVDIAKGLAKQNKYTGDENILTDIVSFHMDWQEETNLVDDVQCFTIREIEGIIRALAQKKNVYDTIMTVYGARYQKKMKEQLKNKLKNYETLKDLKPSSLTLPKEFPHCFSNNNLCETVSSVLFSLSNQRHAIIVGEDESGITQVARWCAECFNRMTSEENNYSAKNNCFCLCTKNLQYSDLIGQTKPCPKNDKGENNEILKFFPGFLVSAIEEGKTVVLDCINEANATVGERLNGLLDKKNNAEEEFFDLPENTERLRIPIHKNFRMICTCNINNIKDMSPAFVNRFDVIVLENQLENLSDNQLSDFITNIYVSFDRIPEKKKKLNLIEQQNLEGIHFDDEDEEEEENQNNEEENEINENKEEIIKKEKEFSDTE